MKHLWLLAALVWGCVSLAAGAQEMQSPPPGRQPQLEPVPRPSLEAVEPLVAEGLEADHAAVDALLAQAREPEGIDGLELADAFVELALSYHAHAFYESALAGYRNAARLLPDDPRWPHAIGVAEATRSNLEAATTAFENALRLDPSSPATRLHLADAHLAAGRLDDADALARSVLDELPDQPAALDLVGRIALERREFQTAADAFEAALVKLPDANRLHYPLALAYRGLGDLDAARRHLELRGGVGVRPPDPLLAAIEERESGVRAMILRGRRAFRYARYADAAAAFARAVDADPTHLAARVNLGASLIQAGDLDAGEAALRAALELDPDNGETWHNLGRVALMRGKPTRAANALRRAVALDGDDFESRRQLAVALQHLGDKAGAATQLQAVVGGAPHDENAHLALAQLLLDLGRNGAALTALRQAAADLPNSERIAAALSGLEAALAESSTDPQ
ncbi:MAG: tetratricopeptide repeat protein [Acidobacteriota bacterium]